MFEHPWPRRIHIVGTSGAGKTTLARSLARALGYPHIELDALNWEPGWTEAPLPVFQDRVRQAAAAPSWVVDGNYGKARSQLWEGTPSVVWLDYPFPVVMGRIVSRTIRRVATREELWNGNRERFRTSFASRESIIWWSASTFQRRRRELPALFAANPQIQVLRLGHPSEAERLLDAARRYRQHAQTGLDVNGRGR